MYYTYAHYTADKSRLFYIGKGTANRMHSRGSRSQYWHNIVAKHGLHVERLAFWETEADAFAHEKLLISCWQDLSHLCNLTEGGEGCSGYQWTEEQKSHMRGKLPHNAGKNWDEATKRKISQTQLGRPRGAQSAEHSEKIAQALTNKAKSSAHAEKCRFNALKGGAIVRTCPHCGYEGRGANIFRWHFENCQKKA